jgi:hypothetical protein
MICPPVNHDFPSHKIMIYLLNNHDLPSQQFALSLTMICPPMLFPLGTQAMGESSLQGIQIGRAELTFIFRAFALKNVGHPSLR